MAPSRGRRVSEHLWLTGNTYVLTSKDNVCLMLDPWEKRSADQFAKLQKDHQLGPLEVLMFSHAAFRSLRRHLSFAESGEIRNLVAGRGGPADR